MANTTPDLQSDDWRRIRDALRYLGRDLHHRSFAVSAERRSLLWEEMDRCLQLAERLADVEADGQIAAEDALGQQLPERAQSPLELAKPAEERWGADPQQG
jgi:hypothetical protein